MQHSFRCHNRKKDTPPHPPIICKNSLTKRAETVKNISIETKICHENSKSSYHLTGKPIKHNTVNSSRAGRLKKSILPELTCSYLKTILPLYYLTYLSKVLIYSRLYMQR